MWMRKRKTIRIKRKKNENVNDPEFVKEKLRKLTAKKDSLEKTMLSNVHCFEKVEENPSKLVPKNKRGREMANRLIILSAEIDAKNLTLIHLGEKLQ